MSNLVTEIIIEYQIIASTFEIGCAHYLWLGQSSQRMPDQAVSNSANLEYDRPISTQELFPTTGVKYKARQLDGEKPTFGFLAPARSQTHCAAFLEPTLEITMELNGKFKPPDQIV